MPIPIPFKIPDIEIPTEKPLLDIEINQDTEHFYERYGGFQPENRVTEEKVMSSFKKITVDQRTAIVPAGGRFLDGRGDYYQPINNYITVNTRTNLEINPQIETQTAAVIGRQMNALIHRELSNAFLGTSSTATTHSEIGSYLRIMGQDLIHRSVPVTIVPNLTTGTVTTSSATTSAGYYRGTNAIQFGLTSYADINHVIVNGVRIHPDAFGVFHVEVDAFVNDATAYAVTVKGWAKERMINEIRHKMRNHAIIIRGKNSPRKVLKSDPTEQEQKAKQTLRDMITESEYRRYLTNGFIMVKGTKSGLWYQIFSRETGERVRTYKDGKPFESLCIHTDASCPPTDHVINMKILAEIDEETLRKGANISRLNIPNSFNVYRVDSTTPITPEMTLLETFQALKKTA